MTVRLELAPEVQAGLLAQAQNSGTTLEAIAEQVLARHVQETRLESVNGEHRPIWDVISDITKDVPDEVFERLPKDGASQVDHYIYGLPKRDERSGFSPILSTGWR